MFKFKLLILGLFINLIFLTNCAQAALLVDKRPYYTSASVQSTSSNTQILYTAFSLPDSASVSKFNWWGGKKENINWKLSFYESVLNQENKLDLGNIVYQNTFSSSDLTSNFKDPNYSYEYFYSYELNKDLILEANKSYFVSIEALINDSPWGWTLNKHSGSNSIAIYPLEGRKNFGPYSYSYQLEGVSPAPVPEPSTMILGLISLTGILRIRKKKFQ
jgi:hypothetical protein